MNSTTETLPKPKVLPPRPPKPPKHGVTAPAANPKGKPRKRKEWWQ